MLRHLGRISFWLNQSSPKQVHLLYSLAANLDANTESMATHAHISLTFYQMKSRC